VLYQSKILQNLTTKISRLFSVLKNLLNYKNPIFVVILVINISRENAISKITLTTGVARNFDHGKDPKWKNFVMLFR